MTKDEQARHIREGKWFHSIDLGDGRVTPGRFDPQRPQNYTLYGVLRFLEQIDLGGMRCLDIGTMDGLAAFVLAQGGAAQVVATDMARRNTFLAARSTLGLEQIEYVVPARMDTLEARCGKAPFDLIVCAGVLYHVFEPLTALVICRERLKLDGLLLLETQYRKAEPRAVMAFSPADRRFGSEHANTFFQPSYDALAGMLEVAGFEVVASIAVGSRVTVLARAARPGEISSPRPMIAKIHRTYGAYRNYGERIDYAALSAQNDRSSIRWTGRPGTDAVIHASRFRTRFALQPVFRAGRLRRLKLLLLEWRTQWRTSIARRRWLPALNEPAGGAGADRPAQRP